MEDSTPRVRPTTEMKWYVAFEAAGAVYLLARIPMSQPLWQPFTGAVAALLLVTAVATCAALDGARTYSLLFC